jgi:hypothetical protein
MPDKLGPGQHERRSAEGTACVHITRKRRVCGIDICGEPAADADMRDIMQSSAVNRQILALPRRDTDIGEM